MVYNIFLFTWTFFSEFNHCIGYKRNSKISNCQIGNRLSEVCFEFKNKTRSNATTGSFFDTQSLIPFQLSLEKLTNSRTKYKNAYSKRVYFAVYFICYVSSTKNRPYILYTLRIYSQKEGVIETNRPVSLKWKAPITIYQKYRKNLPADFPIL